MLMESCKLPLPESLQEVYMSARGMKPLGTPGVIDGYLGKQMMHLMGILPAHNIVLYSNADGDEEFFRLFPLRKSPSDCFLDRW
jgi:hypothetical protein